MTSVAAAETQFQMPSIRGNCAFATALPLRDQSGAQITIPAGQSEVEFSFRKVDRAGDRPLKIELTATFTAQSGQALKITKIIPADQCFPGRDGRVEVLAMSTPATNKPFASCYSTGDHELWVDGKIHGTLPKDKRYTLAAVEILTDAKGSPVLKIECNGVINAGTEFNTKIKFSYLLPLMPLIF